MNKTHISDLDYHLPKSSIAQDPYQNPEDSKILDAESMIIHKFENIDNVIPNRSLIVFNNSQVIDVRVKTTWPDTLPDMEFDFPKWNKVNLIEQSLYHIDFATDDHHPGPESQKLIASDILERIKLAY